MKSQKSVQQPYEKQFTYFKENSSDRITQNLRGENLKLFKLIRKKKKLAYDPKFKQGRWNDSEHREFLKGILKIGKNNWKKVKFIF